MVSLVPVPLKNDGNLDAVVHLQLVEELLDLADRLHVRDRDRGSGRDIQRERDRERQREREREKQI